MKAAIYNASAGAGKTYRLAYKYVRDVVSEPTLYRNILAVTFTNKATEEMKRRILSQIHTLAVGEKSGYLSDLISELGLTAEQIQHRAERVQSLILHDYSRFTVLTIDKFFQRVLRAFIQEIGIDIGYNLEIESASIVAQSADALIEQITSDEELRRWLMALVQERIDDGRRWSVRDGILALESELFKEQAYAALDTEGSKEGLEQMIKQMEERSYSAIAEIKAIAEEALAVIAAAGYDGNSFKGKSRSLAHIFSKIVSTTNALPKLTDTQRNSASQIAKWCDEGSGIEPTAQLVMPMLVEIVRRYESDTKQINTSRLLRENYRSFALMYDLYHKTQEICREQNTMILSQTPRIIEEFVSENDAPFIYEKVGSRFSHFMIDEFQDTSRREWRNFLPLLRDSIAQAEPDDNRILIVGDIKQSIYRWRGGDWRILHSDAKRELGEQSTEVINMVDNYRSLPRIVGFNNAIIERIVEGQELELNGEIAAAYSDEKIDSECYRELYGVISSAYKGHAQNPKRVGESDGFVEVVTYHDDPPLMERICEAIERGFDPCDIMILTRSNSEASKVAQTLLAFKQHNSNPLYQFDVMTQEALIVGYAPVSNFIVAVLHLAINLEDGLQHAIYNKFLGYEYIDAEFDDDELEFLDSIRMLAPIEAFESIIMRYNLESEKSQIAYIQAIQEQVIAYSKSKIGDISLFLEWWHEKGATQSLRIEKSRNAIEILTIHKAKGLEKKVVIVPFSNWDHNPKSSGVRSNIVWSCSSSDESHIGAVPIAYKQEMANSEFANDYYREKIYTRIDNINTLYVAITRAVESLHIFIKTTESSNKARGIGEVILNALPEGGVASESEQGRRYIYGEPSSPSHSAAEGHSVEPLIMDRYQSSPTDLRLRLPSQRYHSEDGQAYAPREVGILMHKAFEQAHSFDDILSNVEKMLLDGYISAEQRELLLFQIQDSSNDYRVKEWFSGEWETIRNEAEIIIPSATSNRRPDRIMIRGRRAVVVDYKFGEQHRAQHSRQVRGYVELLRSMGYSDVEGYIWYIRSNEIVEVG